MTAIRLLVSLGLLVWGTGAFVPPQYHREAALSTSSVELNMVFDFFKQRSSEGLDQLGTLADAAYKGQLGQGFKDVADYTSTTNAAFASGLAKSRDRLKQDLELILTGESEDMMEDLLDILLQADLGMATSEDVVAEVKSLRNSGQKFRKREDLVSVMRGKLIEALDTGKPGVVQFSDRKDFPTVLFIMGANGMGKTTTIGKLAHRLRSEGNQTVLMAACDTFRAGAVEQLEQWADRAEVDCFGPSESISSPSAVLYGALDKALAENYDTLLVDTSGRLSNNDPLTAELVKMKRVIQKRMSVEKDEDGKPMLNTNVPHETLLVIDAAQGRMALDSAKIWDKEVGLTGLILTKLDGSARGGAVVAVSRELALPVKLIGVGEGLEDLRDFEPENFVDGLLGIGKVFGGKSANEGAELASRLSDMRKERDTQAKADSKKKKALPTNTPDFGGDGGAAGDLTFDSMDGVTPITDFQPTGGGGRGGGGGGVANKSKKKKKKSSNHRRSAAGRGDEILVRDEDDEFLGRRRQTSDDEEDDEDRPTVVEDVTGGGSTTAAAWQDVVASTTKSTTIDNKERSSDDDNDGRLSSRKRYDSDDDSSAPRRPIRRRYDSDESSSSKRRTTTRRTGDDDSDDDAGRNNKRRYDSDDDGDRNNNNNKPPVMKRRYDSDNDDDEPVVRIKRSDSDAEEQQQQQQPSSRRRRYDSDNDSDPPPHDDDSKTKRVKTNSSDDDSEQEKTRERMSSGHVAGLQQAGDFRGAEQEIQRKRRKDAQAMVDRHGMGETVYRDELGRKVDEVPTATTKKSSVPQLNEKDQVALNKGRVQKTEEERLKKQFRELQQSSFARRSDDVGLENIRKDVIREGDPMAAYAMKKKAKVRAASGKPVRPVYKGPAPKPNRFGIRPGYRWDGVDRGNGFEDKALGSKYSPSRKKEEAHRWSTSDM